MQHKIRINDLARELEVKSREILDVLPKVGITEKKTHSSSIEEDEAERVKKYFEEHEPSSSRASRSAATSDEFKPKIDLSHISKPGDVLKAITQRTQPAAAPPRSVAPPTPRPIVTPPSAVAPKPAAPAASAQPAAPAEAKPAPRFITPQSVARPPASVFMPPPKPVATPAPPHAQTRPASEAARATESSVETSTAVLDRPAMEAPEVGEVETAPQVEAATPAPAAPTTNLPPAARSSAPMAPAQGDDRTAAAVTSPARPAQPPQPHHAG